MIHYQLRCHAAHDFDGWYRDSAAFDQLCTRGLVECPHCGSVSVSRALMAPAIATRRRQRGGAMPTPEADAAPGETKALVPAASSAPDGKAPDGGTLSDAGKADVMSPEARGVPDRLRAMLQRMRATVEQNCDYVGGDFAAEARRIHEGEIAPRGIYGEATADEAEALAEDGIDVARIPWVRRAES